MDLQMKYYILNGHDYVEELDPIAWAVWHQTADRGVALDRVEAYQVSTVFLGMDHGFSGEEEPILFETMVFLEGSFVDVYCERYSTWEKAEEGHRRIVQKVKSGEFKESESRVDQEGEVARAIEYVSRMIVRRR